MKTLDFSAILAISIHDMKNSLNMVLNSLDALLDTETGHCICKTEQVARLRYETHRVRNNLVQLLALYRNEQGLYQPRFVPVTIMELLEDAWLINRPTMDNRGIDCALDCDESLIWNLDPQLIDGVLENVLNNSIRYTNDRLRLAGTMIDGWLSLTVDDNGGGFPEGMLGRRQVETSGDFKRHLGTTGLGLHFCALVADLHGRGGQRGYVELANGGALGGGRFEIRIPQLPPSGFENT